MQQVQEKVGPAAGAAPEMGSRPEMHRTNSGDEVVLNTTRARQGVTGHHVRFVLGFGIAGAVVVFAAAAYLVATGAFG